MRFVQLMMLTVALLTMAALAGSNDTQTERKPVPAALNFTINSIDGKPVDLAKYHGKVVMIVNVASKCGLTPQYKQLQALHEKYHDKGLVILGFPANNFGNQEPGANGEIAAFCEKNYGVKFQMFEKVSVLGEDICPLYKHLTTSSELDESKRGDVKWNFEKFLIGRDGKVVDRFRSKTAPDAPEVVAAIEAELAKK